MNHEQEVRFEEAQIEQIKARTRTERTKAFMCCAIGVAALALGFAAAMAVVS